MSNRNQRFHSDHTTNFQTLRRSLLNVTVPTVISDLAGIETQSSICLTVFPIPLIFNCFGCHIVSLFDFPNC